MFRTPGNTGMQLKTRRRQPAREAAQAKRQPCEA